MAQGFQIGRRELWTCALIVLLSLGLRLFYLSELSTSPLFAVPVVDARTYVDDARYLSEVSWAGRPTPFWQPPLYPYLLGLLFSVSGENYTTCPACFKPYSVRSSVGVPICSASVSFPRLWRSARVWPPLSTAR